jgi:hypothetical protein
MSDFNYKANLPADARMGEVLEDDDLEVTGCGKCGEPIKGFGICGGCAGEIINREETV